MSESTNYIEINKETWNRKTAIHYSSDFYAVNEFIAGKTSLNSIELDLFPNLQGKSVLHLQCHFGQDSISLSRLGAKVTGVDFSDKAIETAKKLADRTKQEVHFICCDIYDLPQHLNQQFDFVFLSYGTIGWLPDLNRWAKIVSQFLRTAGEFLLVEFHPFIWMYDNDFKKIEYSYFNVEAIIEEETGSYAEKDADLQSKSVTWNHPISEVITALIDNQISITGFKEYDYSPYDCLSNLTQDKQGHYQLEEFGNKIPMVYALSGKKLKD